jgi:hypothetical protein
MSNEGLAHPGTEQLCAFGLGQFDPTASTWPATVSQ